MMKERDSPHIHHRGVFEEFQSINMVTLKHTGGKEPLIVNKDKDVTQTHTIIQKYINRT